jgi:uncharacterized membrane protein YphA (DoxX/SURF4 family)
MKAPLARLNNPIYAAIRIVAGLLFMMNGAQKLFGAFGEQPESSSSAPAC